MKNKYLNILFLSLLTLGSCGKNNVSSDNNDISSSVEEISKESQTTNEFSYTLPESSKEFVDFVANIDFNLHSQDDINAAFNLYNALDDDSWNFDEVLDAFERLVQMESMLNSYNYAARFIENAKTISYFATANDLDRINALINMYYELPVDAKQFLDVEYEFNRILTIKDNINKNEEEKNEGQRQIAIANFVSQVAQIPEPAAITLEDDDLLSITLDMYNKLDTKSKEDNRVIEAYNKLEASINRYNEIKDNPAIKEEALINRFLADVLKIPSLDILTLDDLPFISNAKASYQNLSQESRNLDNVKENYAAVVAANNKYDQLYKEHLEAEKLQQLIEEATPFIEAMESFGEQSSLTKADLSSLIVAENLYNQLSHDAKQLPSVVDAYDKLVSDKQYIYDNFEFDKLEVQLNDIDKSSSTPPTVQLKTTSSALYTYLKNLYGVSKNSELENKVAMYLYIYNEGETDYLVKANISTICMTKSLTLITSANMLNILKEASTHNKDVKSGSFNLGISFEDLTGNYSNSDIYKDDTVFEYSFESQYQGDEDYVIITNASEFLDIALDLSGKYKLGNDIDMSGIEWTNLGKFSGILDGNGYALTNLTRNNGGDSDFGIFSDIETSGIVTRLGLFGNVENAGTYAGAITVRNKGTISNCYINLNIKNTDDPIGDGTYSNDGCIGGICTENLVGGLITNCIVRSKITGTSTHWGNLDGGICVGQYGTVTNTYCVKDNISNGAAVGNSQSSLTECLKTEAELKNISLYVNFDNNIWILVDGVIPELKRG